MYMSVRGFGYVSSLGISKCRYEGECNGGTNGGGGGGGGRDPCMNINCAICTPCVPGQKKEEGGKKYVCKTGSTSGARTERCIECCDGVTMWVLEDGGDGGGGGGGPTSDERGPTIIEKILKGGGLTKDDIMTLAIVGGIVIVAVVALR